jgi:hypothetical protein
MRFAFGKTVSYFMLGGMPKSRLKGSLAESDVKMDGLYPLLRLQGAVASKI